jgi:hypothetical protein
MEFFDVGSFTEGKYSLQLNLWDKRRREKWNFINIYGAAQEEHKDEFLAELADRLNKNKEPVLVGGDFNIIRFSSEKNKGGIHKHSGVFNSIINSFELIDLEMAGGKYTWSNNQKNPTLVRLDRFLVIKSWEDIFPVTMVYKIPREMSNHNPIILTLPTKSPVKSLHFRFEMFWFRHQEFMPKVFEFWNIPCHGKLAFDRIQCKLKRFKQYFKGWGHNTRGINKNCVNNGGGSFWCWSKLRNQYSLMNKRKEKLN